MSASKTFHVAFRLLLLGGVFFTAFLDFGVRLWLRGRAGSIKDRALFLQRWARVFSRVFHLEIQARGTPPARGLLVANHLSYLDILSFGSRYPMVFVSKSEVASWPVVGALTRCAGTLYIVRGQKSDVVRLGNEMVAVLEQGVLVTLFPEGTSSDGSAVLPFRSSLLAPVESRGWPATPAWVHYELDEGSVVDEVCYWRDMTFGAHLLNVLSKRRIRATVCFGTPVTGIDDRKELARELHARVCQLKDEFLAGASAGPSVRV